jgi:hypothetical protein
MTMTTTTMTTMTCIHLSRRPLAPTMLAVWAVLLQLRRPGSWITTLLRREGGGAHLILILLLLLLVLLMMMMMMARRHRPLRRIT